MRIGLAPVVQQRDPPGDVVEHQERAGRDERGVGAGRAAAGQPFEAPHEVVADRADASPRLSATRGFLRPRTGGAFARARRSASRGGAGLEADCRRVAEPDERVPAEPLAALHALEQEPRSEAERA